jgi:hypothetical protein
MPPCSLAYDRPLPCTYQNYTAENSHRQEREKKRKREQSQCEKNKKLTNAITISGTDRPPTREGLSETALFSRPALLFFNAAKSSLIVSTNSTFCWVIALVCSCDSRTAAINDARSLDCSRHRAKYSAKLSECCPAPSRSAAKSASSPRRAAASASHPRSADASTRLFLAMDVGPEPLRFPGRCAPSCAAPSGLSLSPPRAWLPQAPPLPQRETGCSSPSCSRGSMSLEKLTKKYRERVFCVCVGHQNDRTNTRYTPVPLVSSTFHLLVRKVHQFCQKKKNREKKKLKKN